MIHTKTHFPYCPQIEKKENKVEHGALPKNSPHTKFERTWKQNRLHFVEPFQWQIFFSSSSLAGWDDVSSRWVPLLNLSFLFFFHRPYVWFIYLLFTVYFDFGRIFLFSYFFGACDGDDLSSSGSESPYTISLLLFSSFASKWEREKRSRYRCRHSCRDEDGREKCAGGIA